jgi:antitoxin (DNA-binding transcriptional repressor) of toxin-antitoxin stability system
MTVTIEEAQARLAKIIEHLESGEEITITKDQMPIARLIGEGKRVQRPRRRLGTLKGSVSYIAPDFNAACTGLFGWRF